MKLRTLLPSALVITLGTAAAPAQAQQWPTADPSYSAADPSLATGPEVFGSPGQIVVSSEFDLDVRFDKPSGADSGVTTLKIAPALMFFLVRNLAVGGLLDFSYSKPENGSITTLRVGPVAAFNVPLSPRLSLLPTVGLTYGWSSREQDVQGGQKTTTGNAVTLLARVPVLFHPFTHVFVGFGPFVDFGLSAEFEGTDVPKTRTYGLTLDFGFWL